MLHTLEHADRRRAAYLAKQARAIECLKIGASLRNAADAATVPEALWQLLAHEAVELDRESAAKWPVRWETGDDGQLEPARELYLTLDSGWCFDVNGEHHLSIETMDDLLCAAAGGICECECRDCADNYHGSDHDYDDWKADL